METFFGRLKNEMYCGYEKEYSTFEEFAKTSFVLWRRLQLSKSIKRNKKILRKLFNSCSF